MSTILALTSSALTSSALAGESASSQLVGYTLDQLAARDRGARIVVRDLGANHIPHLDADSAQRSAAAMPPTRARPGRSPCRRNCSTSCGRPTRW